MDKSAPEASSSFVEKMKRTYHANYKKFFIVPALAVLFSLLVIGVHFAKTGEIVSLGIDLKGGVITTINWDANANSPDIRAMKAYINSKVADSVEIHSTQAYSEGRMRLAALSIEAGPQVNATLLKASIAEALSSQGFSTNPDKYDTKIVGPAVGAAFLTNTYISLLVGFLLISFVIFMIFKAGPVIATVTSCIFFDFIGAIAVMNLLGIKLTPITLAALLILIGFSIDSDILITTAVLRRHDGHTIDRAYLSMKTGVTMILAAAASLLALYAFSGIPVIRDLTTILIGGLFFDILHTWFTNLGILLWIAEKREEKGAAA